MKWELVHPKARGAFMRLEEELMRQVLAGESDVLFKPFEGYRTPERQLELYKKGTTKAVPFQSAHQYGLAVDYVPYDPVTGWFWPEASDPAWNILSHAATQYGLLQPIPWDRPHIEHPLWRAVKGRLAA